MHLLSPRRAQFTMRCVTSLPSDILQLILPHLSPSEKAALARACKSLHHVASVALYGVIVMRWDTGRPTPPPPIHYLLRTLLKHPDLARLVTNLIFLGSKNDSIWGRGARWHYYPTPDELAPVTTIIRTLDLPEHPPNLFEGPTDDNTWLRLAARGHTELYQGLLVLQLPNLSTLTVGYDGYMSFTFLSTLMEHILISKILSSNAPSFRRLQQVDLCTEPLIREMDSFLAGYQHTLREVLPFFYLPSLRVLRAVAPWNSQPIVWPTAPPYCQTLVTLQLLRSELEPPVLKQLLSVTPRLKTLNYDLVCKTWYQMQNAPYLECDVLSSALLPVAKSLVSLTISVQLYGANGTWYKDPDIMMAIRGLLDFAQLEQIQRLEAPLILFLGQTSAVNPTLAERLPPSLRSLFFNDDLALFNAYPWRATAVLEYFRCIFDRARAFNTGLTDLGLLLREFSEDWSDEDQAEFRKICHSAGFTSTTHRALR